MKRVLELLDAARDVCGSDAALARRIGVDPSHPAHWRRGRPMTAVTVGLLADVVGLSPDDAQRMALIAVIEGVKDTKKQGGLRRVFFALSELSSGSVHGGKPKIAALQARRTETRVPIDGDLTKRALVQLEPEHDIHWRGLRSGWERAALLLRGALNVILPARPACS